jgi:DNA gyrase subunit B
MTRLHAGGKFDKRGYKVSGGLHGVGVSAVCALSSWMQVDVRRNKKLHRQEFAAGKPIGDIKIVGRAEGTGTKVTFVPDSTIFPEVKFDFDLLTTRLREMAYLNAGLKISLAEEATGRECSFYFEGGIASFVRHLNQNKLVLIPKPIYLTRDFEESSIEVALQYNDDYTETIFCFANAINTTDGGTHLSGFRSALTRTLNAYARKANILKEQEANLSSDDVREGLTAIISVKLQEPQFEAQTKVKLSNPRSALKPRSRSTSSSTPTLRKTRVMHARSSRSASLPPEPVKRPASARSGAAQDGPGWHDASRQAGGLSGARPLQVRAVSG